MYRLLIASLIAVAVAGCGGAKNGPSASTAASPSGSVSSAALFDQTQAASAKEDWTAYCKAIDDMRTELGM